MSEWQGESLGKGLVSTKIDSKKYPPRNYVSLTDKGRKVAKHLKEIEGVLEG